jgi:hypothetical protein
MVKAPSPARCWDTGEGGGGGAGSIGATILVTGLGDATGATLGQVEQVEHGAGAGPQVGQPDSSVAQPDRTATETAQIRASKAKRILFPPSPITSFERDDPDSLNMFGTQPAMSANPDVDGRGNIDSPNLPPSAKERQNSRNGFAAILENPDEVDGKIDERNFDFRKVEK